GRHEGPPREPPRRARRIHPRSPSCPRPQAQVTPSPRRISMFHHRPRIAMFYRPEMAPSEAVSFSKSPTKPRRFMEFLCWKTPIWPYVDTREDFHPVDRAQLLNAHTGEYVDAFLTGDARLAESNGIHWSEEFRDSVLLTNGSLVAAIHAACRHPETIAMSPTSGFHHAGPEGGEGFCTFSGQVIAALELYGSCGKVGAWVDLDGHFGNSIEDSREFAPALNDAIPYGCNINPRGAGHSYLNDLSFQMEELGKRVMAGKVDYVCVAHGADSHEWDSL